MFRENREQVSSRPSHFPWVSSHARAGLAFRLPFTALVGHLLMQLWEPARAHVPARFLGSALLGETEVSVGPSKSNEGRGATERRSSRREV